MNSILFSHLRDSHDSRFLPLVFLAASFLMLSGCTYVPDAMNPAEWYRDTASWIRDDEEEEAKEAGPDADAVKTAHASDVIPGADKDYPKLSSVPDAPPNEEHQKTAEGLAADTANRRYSDEMPPPAPAVVTQPPARQGVAGNRVPPPPPPMSEPGVPPMAAPRESVTSELGMGAPKAPPQLSPSVARVMEKARPPTPSSESMSGDVVKDENSFNPLKKFDVSRTTVSTKVGLIQFSNGSAGLSSADRRQLKSIADSQKKDGGTLRVIGFSSSATGNMDQLKHQLMNFNISMRRANSVAAALMEYGVTGKSLYVEAQSDSKPIYLEVMPAGEAGNRRAEIYLVH